MNRKIYHVQLLMSFLPFLGFLVVIFWSWGYIKKITKKKWKNISSFFNLSYSFCWDRNFISRISLFYLYSNYKFNV